MLKRQLNRDIKKLKQLHLALKEVEYTEGTEKDFKKEFIRLYRADQNCTYMNVESLKTMIRINHTKRYISLHTFFISIDL